MQNACMLVLRKPHFIISLLSSEILFSKATFLSRAWSGFHRLHSALMMDCSFGNYLALSLEPGVSVYIEGQRVVDTLCNLWLVTLGKGFDSSWTVCSNVDVMSVRFRNRLAVLSDLIMGTGIMGATPKKTASHIITMTKIVSVNTIKL